MKKVLIILSVLLFISPFSAVANENKAEDELTKNGLKTALYPYIEKAIADYKKQTQYYAPLSMNFGLYQADILNVQKKNNVNSFLLKIRLHTFEHAHSPPHFEVTTTLDVSLNDIKIVNFKVDEDEKAKAIKEFYQKALSDIRQSFGLNLKSYKVYNSTEVPKGLRNTITNITKNILNPKINPPYKNVIDPVTFLKNDKGYVLFKKSDGTNVVYTIQKEDDTWKIINKESKQGEKMPEELIWYM
ncbi:hypothetical protein GCM10008983_03740 [Lentibacillus halophilus]|uniref:DUF3888 domain-containing protein n=1 Tax=Lentibacillus halophilus TaxID=295065 RepID=A0ABP3IWL3_9BACI